MDFCCLFCILHCIRSARIFFSGKYNDNIQQLEKESRRCEKSDIYLMDSQDRKRMSEQEMEETGEMRDETDDEMTDDRQMTDR